MFSGDNWTILKRLLTASNVFFALYKITEIIYCNSMQFLNNLYIYTLVTLITHCSMWRANDASN